MKVFLIACGAAVVIWLFVLMARHAVRLRREYVAAMRGVAERFGLRFSEQRLTEFDERYPQFDAFARGSDRYAYDTLRGAVSTLDADCAITVGTYHYETKDSDDDTTTHRFPFLLLQLPWPTPQLELRPESFLDRVAGWFGANDIDFESEQFSRMYHVSASDKRFAYDVLHPRTIEFLQKWRPHLLQICDGHLLLLDGSGTWDAEECANVIDFVLAFCELWPRHLQS